MSANPLEGWDNFFVAEAGAAAALAGLLFVAVSINLARILQFPQLPARAVEALVALFSVLVVATWALVPRQSATACGWEIGLTGLAAWGAQTLSLLRTRTAVHPRYALRVLMNQLPPLPFVACGALLLAGRDGAVYWVVPGTLLSFLAGLFDAWVLLVEIQR